MLNNLQKLWMHCEFLFYCITIPERKPSSELERPSEEPGAGTVPCCKHMLPSSAPQPHSSSASCSVKPQTIRTVDKFSSTHQISNYKRWCRFLLAKKKNPPLTKNNYTQVCGKIVYTNTIGVCLNPTKDVKWSCDLISERGGDPEMLRYESGWGDVWWKRLVNSVWWVTWFRAWFGVQLWGPHTAKEETASESSSCPRRLPVWGVVASWSCHATSLSDFCQKDSVEDSSYHRHFLVTCLPGIKNLPFPPRWANRSVHYSTAVEAGGIHPLLHNLLTPGYSTLLRWSNHHIRQHSSALGAWRLCFFCIILARNPWHSVQPIRNPSTFDCCLHLVVVLPCIMLGRITTFGKL